jgi:hypothetical protein
MRAYKLRHGVTFAFAFVFTLNEHDPRDHASTATTTSSSAAHATTIKMLDAGCFMIIYLEMRISIAGYPAFRWHSIRVPTPSALRPSPLTKVFYRLQ